jgi:hypothetical protein
MSDLICPVCRDDEIDLGLPCEWCSGTGRVDREAYRFFGRQYQREQILSAQSDAHQEKQ